MKVMVLGSGAREHAIAWLFSRSRLVEKLYTAEGNAGTAFLGENINVDPHDAQATVAAAKKAGADLVFVGPEAVSAAGTVNALEAAGISVIGPNREAARLETSKLFSKDFLRRHKIPTAEAAEFSDGGQFEAYIRGNAGKKLVVKKNGLAAGKGVLESDDPRELISFGLSILKNDSLLVEEFLTGWEVSIFGLGDGKHYKTLLSCADHKKALDNDLGPNTGGMGAICPVPRVDRALEERIEREIVAPTYRGLAADGIFYKGVVYFGLMITAGGPKVLEYNVRFGDPEAQVLLPLIKTDFGEIARAIADGRLDEVDLQFHAKTALGVVVAANGYPGGYEKNLPVAPIEPPPETEAVIFHASTKIKPESRVLTGGGRCFTVVGLGDNLKESSDRAYRHIDRVKFDGAWYRKDIGKKFFS